MKIASAPPAWHSMHCSTSGLRAVNSFLARLLKCIAASLLGQSGWPAMSSLESISHIMWYSLDQ